MRTFKEILASAKGNITEDILVELSEAADRENISMLEVVEDLLGGKIPECWKPSYRITIEAKEGDSYSPIRVLDTTDFLLGVKDKHDIKVGVVGNYLHLLEIYLRVGVSLGEEHLNKAHKVPFTNPIEASIIQERLNREGR
jgi:hypothetical protein